MSHTSTYAVKIKDIDLLCKTALAMGHKVDFVNMEQEKEVHFFGSNSVQAVTSIKIDGWKYSIAVNKNGEVLYDHWGSEPNTMEKLGKLLQQYSFDLIVNNLPMDIVKNYYDERVKETGEHKLILEYE